MQSNAVAPLLGHPVQYKCVIPKKKSQLQKYKSADHNPPP